MKLKKIVTIVLVCSFAFSSVAFAAIGGAKFSAPRAPSISTPSKTSSATTSSNAYTPSKNAQSLSKDAPATSTKSATTPATSSSPWGGMMRNVGLFAGGMFLGSMLSNMFGMGGMGMGSDIMGLLMNVVLLGAIFMIGRSLWNKFQNKGNNVNHFARSQQDVSPYRNKYDIASKQNDEELPNIIPKHNSYQSKSKADEYRNR
jgi:hypothetical protein